MSNKAKTPLVPKLRFPQFKNSDEWSPQDLGDCLDYLQPTEYLVNSTAYNDKHETPVVTAGKTFILGYTNETEGVFNEPLPVIIFDDFTTASQFVDFPFKAKSSAMKILLAKKNANIKFLYESMQQINYEVGAHGRHWISAYSRIKVAVPEPSEQQKIADCLSSLDELIAAQARKVAALKTHKKGLMQQLFPREGETQPRLRFPEFRDAGAWSKRKLSNFLTERSQFPENKVPLYSLTIEDGVTPKTERYERAFLVNDEAEAYKLVLPNDFAFNPMNLRFGAIGRHSGTEAVAVSKYYNIFYCDNSVDSRFCDIYFRSDAMVRFYDTMAIGSLIEKRRVHFSDFLKFNIRFPSSLEQQRIADCIASLDTLITATIQELEALKIHKKGLMQQLFPQGETLS